MLLFRSISHIILLVIIFQSTVGTKEDNAFSDGDYYGTKSGRSGHDDIDIFTVNGTRKDSNGDEYVNYKFDTLMNNGIVNIMMDVKLLSVVLLRGLHNILIIGHDNPTVSCDSAGGIHFEHCQNCTIRGIVLENCGNTNGSKQPAVKLHKSSDITIQNCTFQHSITQALVISEVVGNININGCKFSFNNKFKGHGAAIYYLPKIKHHSKFRLTISNCIFTNNAMSGDSVVYISSSHNKSRERILFTNVAFLNNQGIPLYISHQTVFASGKILFKGNAGNESGGIFITNHSNVLFHTSDSKFVNNKALHDGGALHIEDNSDVTFEEDSTLTIDDNIATYGGALYIVNNSNVIFEGNSTVTINNNKATDHGGAICVFSNSDVKFQGNSTITINSNTATYGGALYVVNNSHVTFGGNLEVKINKNQATYCGGAIAIFNNSDVTVKGNTVVTITSNDGTRFGGALVAFNNSGATFEENSTIRINKNRARRGGAIYIECNSDIKFKGNSRQKINNNNATHGGAFCIFITSGATFEGNSTTIINNNRARRGGAICIEHSSEITSKGKSKQAIENNQARHGAAIYIFNNSVATFTGDSTAMISNNNQAHEGGAFAVYTDSGVTFKGNCTATINHNQAYFGGAFYIQSNSNVTFKGSSVVSIYNNQATEDGGGILTWNNSAITFDQTSTVIINNNEARNYGGGICLLHYSDLKFKNHTQVTLYNNSASVNGGGLYAGDDCSIRVKDNSMTIFNGNEAFGDGGALYINVKSVISFQDHSSIKFNDNKASHYGGALYFRQNSGIVFEDATFVVFYNNTATTGGGALYTRENCNVIIKGNCTVVFDNNKALSDGGALYINNNNVIIFQENATVKFKNNVATYFGGGICSNSNIKFENNCTVMFIHNEASRGGAIFATFHTVFQDNSTIQFDDNRATTLGGALYISNLTFNGNAAVTFNNNEALLTGGALYSSNSSIAMKQNSTVSFTNNSAERGGAVFISASTLLVSEYSNVTFNNNTAEEDGGAIYLNSQVNMILINSSTVTLNSNTADQHGGAVYSRLTQNANQFIISEINCSDNIARVAGNLLYIDVARSCDDSCVTEEIVGISPSGEEIATSPIKLRLYHPARCISNNTVACKAYYIDNIMLGQEIAINACLLDYYNKPTEVTQFKIIGKNHQNYFIHGSEYASISCNHTIKGISIIGSKPVSSLPLNYSVLFTSDTTVTRKSVRKIISVNLIIGLSPCHPGFRYQNKSRKCECYNTDGVVYCSGSTSAIRRGYWFGNVNGISTVTFCPINYCNFTCCKTTNGYYELSPERVNQCRSHRSGIACGSCEEGYTLSFDSAECIDVNRCTTGQTILTITLTVIYWFVVVIAVFIIMYYQVGIGYFYAITYYYSVVDILLSQHTDISNALYIMVTIMSSLAKITPQVLGHLCLLENMSGIDQQFIHYIHPLAISMMLIFICWLARKSKRLSMFISRGIIRAICFLLLLSYTSMATTSLLLMRSLTFADVDNVYTYLSPNIQYFHGRHLAYGIIAIIFTLLIVIGLPLLLLLEPFLNGKINFVKIKPLLDQFQGCYKDKYRWFAAYYMICRLIIIAIIIADISEVFISRYLLITATTIMALIHLLVRPYADNNLNMSDGAILQLLILVTVLPLFEYFDTFDSSLVVGLAFVLVILPLVQFIVMKIFTSKQTLKVITKKTIKQFSSQNFTQQNLRVNDAVNNKSNFVDLIIDDNMRKNAVICEIPSDERLPDIIWCREPFMEVLNEIKD